MAVGSRQLLNVQRILGELALVPCMLWSTTLITSHLGTPAMGVMQLCTPACKQAVASQAKMACLADGLSDVVEVEVVWCLALTFA